MVNDRCGSSVDGYVSSQVWLMTGVAHQWMVAGSIA